MVEGDKYGRCANVETSLEKMRGWDKQEDYTVEIGNLDLTTGTMGGDTGTVGDGSNRNAYAAVGIENLKAGDITLKYKVVGDTTSTYTLLIGQNSGKSPLPPISTIVGTSGGTTASSVIKIWYKDAAVANGLGPTTIPA